MKLGEWKIMKFFKKALIATAVLSTFGAQAVQLTSKINNHVSQQGLNAGNKAIIAVTDEQSLVLQFSPGVETPAASTITLTFSSGVELGDLFNASATVNNVVGSGVGTISGTDISDAYFNYGTGDTTFNALDVDTNTDGDDFIEFVINDGNALEVNSSFSLVVNTLDTDGIEIDGADMVCYKSVSPTAVTLEEECFPFSDIKDQFAFAVTSPFNGKIHRTNSNLFSKDYEADTGNDDLVFKLTTDESLAASIDNVDVEMTLEGNFTNVNDMSDNTGFADSVTITGGDEVTFTVDEAELTGTNGTKKAVSFTLGTDFVTDLVNDSLSIPKTGDIDIQADFIKGSDKTSLTGDAGEWRLDAAIINVPYVPVLFANTSTSVHITNEGGGKADVRATMVTLAGLNGAAQKVSAEVDLGFIPANSVVKFTQTQLADAFGITVPTKMSVTFNIDANDNQVSAYATVTSATGRTEVSTSRQRDAGVGK